MFAISALSRLVHIAWIGFSVIVPIPRHWAILICIIDHFSSSFISPSRLENDASPMYILVLIYSTRARACLSCVLYIMVLIYCTRVRLSCVLYSMMLIYSTRVRLSCVLYIMVLIYSTRVRLSCVLYSMMLIYRRRVRVFHVHCISRC